MSRYISTKDSKLLYAKSAGRCNICKAKVFNYSASADDYIHTGQMAHNESFSNKAKVRAKLIDQDAPDNSYKNLILLCANHHLEIDQDPTYTIEKIRNIKASFEAHIDKVLGEKSNTDLELLGLINEYIDFQYLMNEIQEPLYSLPFDIVEIADVNNIILTGFSPTLYPFQDENIQKNMESILSFFYELNPYILKYYFIGHDSCLRPIQEKPISKEDSVSISNIARSLYKAIFEWLSYLREKY